MEPVGLRRRHEQPRLLVGPRVDLLLDRRRHLDQLGDVAGDQLLPHRRTENGSKHGVDLLDRPGRQLGPVLLNLTLSRSRTLIRHPRQHQADIGRRQRAQALLADGG